MDADDLYGLPLDQFVPERGKLAKALRSDGRREEASEVAALRKPSVAAWAVNQVVRTQRKATKELFAAGDALRKAQQRLVAGKGDARALRAAGERERAAVDDLVEAARGLLSTEGHELSPAVVERVAETLHAAALDEDARAQVQDGRLERELRHVGFGLDGLAAPAEPAAKGEAKRKEAKREAKPKAAKPAKRGASTGRATKRGASAGRATKRGASPAKRAKRGNDRERADRERAEDRRKREAARKAARAAQTAARRRVERAERALGEAQDRHDRAAQALAKADSALAAARDEAQAALAELEQAERDLKEASR